MSVKLTKHDFIVAKKIMDEMPIPKEGRKVLFMPCKSCFKTALFRLYYIHFDLLICSTCKRKKRFKYFKYNYYASRI